MLRKVFKSKKDRAPKVSTSEFENQSGALPAGPLSQRRQETTATSIPNTSTSVETSPDSGSIPNTASSASPTAPLPTQPPVEDIFHTRGDDYAQNGDYIGAIVMYGEALKSKPSDSTLLLSRSIAHMMTTPPQLDLALKDADAAVQYAPENWQAWLQQGEIRLKMGDMRGAEEALVNAVGFAQGIDKLRARKSLGDVQARRAMSPPSDEQPSSPLPSTCPAPPPSSKLPIRPIPVIPASQATTSKPTPQTSSTTNPMTPASKYMPLGTSVPGPSRTPSAPTIQPATTTQVTSNPTPNIARTTSSSNEPAGSSTQPTSAPTSARTLSQRYNNVWETLYPINPNSPSSAQSETGTGTSSIGLSSNNSASNPAKTTSNSSPLPTASMQPTPARPISQTAGTWNFSSLPAPQPTPSRTTAASPSTSQTTRRPTPNPTTATPSSTAETASSSQTSATSSLNTTTQTRQPVPAGNTTSQPIRPAPVTRAHNSSTVSQTPATLFDPLVDGLFSDPPDAPPSYTPSFNNADPAVRALSQQALQTQFTELQNVLKTRNKGALSIRPYTAAGSIDCIRLFYLGMTQLELTARELGAPIYLHPSFSIMNVDAINYPGSTWLDMDPESSAYYEGTLAGTVSVSGYSEEYREHQLLLSPRLHLSLESNTVLPIIPLDKIVQRIKILETTPTSEDNEGLRNMLGLSQLGALQSGFLNNRQRQIETICMGLNRSLYDAPTRFVDFSKARNISNNTFGAAAQGMGLNHFLYQILLGAELLIRLRKEPLTTSYASLITDAISALIVLSSLWMQNVTITTTPVATSSTIIPGPVPKYTLYALQNQKQIQGLIRFGEALSWPLMHEARAYIENSYTSLIVNPSSVGFDICDWLFGLVLPGKIFRHHIMSCLVYASPSIRSISSAPYWDNGLIVKNKSYWPKRTVLGRVLGGLRNPKTVCGWIGPVPAPEGWTTTDWIRLNSRRVDIPIPISSTAQDTLESLGFEAPEGGETPEAAVQSILDPNEWIQSPGPPPRRAGDTSRTQFKGFHLTEVTGTAAVIGTLNTKQYRASVDFDISGTLTTYILYSNPLFVSAPPCVGTHSMHRRQASKYLSPERVIKVADLKDAYPETDSLVIIDAQGAGEEVVARAWCAERARHAVVRRGPDCCFACAVVVATKSTGLGVNVLIWSN